MKDSCFPELFLKHLLETSPGQFLDVCWVFKICFVSFFFLFPLPQKKCFYVIVGSDLKI